MINKSHAEYVWALLQGSETKILFQGGKPDFEKKFIPPVVISEPDLNSRLMQEEISGPILPILEFSTIGDLLSIINYPVRANPLAIYYFGLQNSEIQKQVSLKTKSGLLMINDIVVHVFTPGLPFGGIGNSGYGSYHGFDGFNNTSHMKPYIEKSKIPMMVDSDLYPDPKTDPWKKARRLKKLIKTLNRNTSRFSAWFKLNIFMCKKYFFWNL